MSLKPQPRVLIIWRLLISFLALIPALLLSLFLTPFRLPWLIGNGLWIAIFLYYFLLHLPQYYHNFLITLEEKYLVVRHGVWYSNIHIIPCQHVQFISRSANPFSQLFGLVTLQVTMAGGFVRLPGLRPTDADILTEHLNRQIVS